MKKIIWIVLCVLSISESSAFAEGFTEAQFRTLESQVQQLTKTVQNLVLTVHAQNREIQTLRATSEGRSLEPMPPQSGGFLQSTAIQGKFNPDIGVLGDVVLKLDSPKEDTEGADRVSVREIELTLGANVDPYSRFDSTIAFSDFEEAELEEMYLTRYELPWDITGRVGKFRPKIGKTNAPHRDSLETVDEPLVIQRYFGIEGVSKSGADLTKILTLPTPMTHELNLGVLEGGNGEDGTAFGESRRRPTLFGHLKNYLDISDTTGLELGGTYLAGSKDADSNFEVQIYGLDTTLIHHLSPNQHLKLQGELFHMNREESELRTEDEDTGEILFHDLDGTLYGGFGLLHYRFHPQWSTGFRFDYVELVDSPLENPDRADVGYTGYLTFYQSEFARWRVQVSHINLADGRDDNQVMLQGTFLIGAHKDKLQ